MEDEEHTITFSDDERQPIKHTTPFRPLNPNSNTTPVTIENKLFKLVRKVASETKDKKSTTGAKQPNNNNREPPPKPKPERQILEYTIKDYNPPPNINIEELVGYTFRSYSFKFSKEVHPIFLYKTNKSKCTFVNKSEFDRLLRKFGIKGLNSRTYLNSGFLSNITIISKEKTMKMNLYHMKSVISAVCSSRSLNKKYSDHLLDIFYPNTTFTAINGGIFRANEGKNTQQAKSFCAFCTQTYVKKPNEILLGNNSSDDDEEKNFTIPEDQEETVKQEQEMTFSNYYDNLHKKRRTNNNDLQSSVNNNSRDQRTLDSYTSYHHAAALPRKRKSSHHHHRRHGDIILKEYEELDEVDNYDRYDSEEDSEYSGSSESENNNLSSSKSNDLHDQLSDETKILGQEIITSMLKMFTKNFKSSVVTNHIIDDNPIIMRGKEEIAEIEDLCMLVALPDYINRCREIAKKALEQNRISKEELSQICEDSKVNLLDDLSTLPDPLSTIDISTSPEKKEL